MKLTLTQEQESAMDQIMRWRANGEWMFYLGGYAGTGKTTLLQEIINRLEKAPICLAPTGKAASVLQKKLTNASVTTIHKALYKPILPSLAELEDLEAQLLANPGAEDLKEAIREEKRKLAEEPLRFMDNMVKEIAPGDLIMVDEASMVTSKMVDDLQRTEAKVLFVGDPGQLPPVQDTGFFSKREPDAILSQIHRQALGNPIIELSMMIRQGKEIPHRIENAHILKREKSGYPIADLTKADQVLTGMNVVRRRVNRGMRKCKGFEGVFPVEGEKLICLKNQFKHGWLINGVQCLSVSATRVDELGNRLLSVLYEGQLLRDLEVYHHPFEAHYNDRAEEDPWASRGQLAEFDYGYAITVHKSQGSEWDKVVMVDDGLFRNRPKERRRWLYTAVTRAKDHLTWLTNE
jgi:exodeoxyribonuclease-5